MTAGQSVQAQPVQAFLFSYDLQGRIIQFHPGLPNLLRHPASGFDNLTVADLLTGTPLLPLDSRARDRDPVSVRLCSSTGRDVAMNVTIRTVFENGVAIAAQVFSLEPQKSTGIPSHLRHLHRLSATTFDSVEDMFAGFLATGCDVFGLPFGFILRTEGGVGFIRAAHYPSAGMPPLQAGTMLPLAGTPFADITGRLRTWGCSDMPSAFPGDLWKGLLATPILLDSELYGVIAFTSAGAAQFREFNAHDKEMLETMAVSIGRLLVADRIQFDHGLTASARPLPPSQSPVLDTLSTHRSQREMLSQIASLMEQQSPGVLCAILKKENGSLTFEAGPSLPASFARLVNERSLPSVPQQLRPADFAFASSFGLRMFASASLEGSGRAPVGALLLFQSLDAARPEPSRDALNLACRLAAIAIEQRSLAARLAFQAQHDFLTGLPNRFRLLELIEQRLLAAELAADAIPPLLAVLYLNLDRFKQINDSLGHSVGDRILIELAERLRCCLPGSRDVAARIGGDEFAIMLEAPPSEAAALKTAAEILEALRQPYRIDGRELFATASIGISFFPRDSRIASTLLSQADAAMYRAKAEGKNGIECFVGQAPGLAQQDAIARLELETALRRALDKSEFELFFQPIVAATSGELEALECLLTWNHATRGRISPGQFIPLAEATGLIVPIGGWVLQEACRLGAAWLREGLPLKRIAVNVSALQFGRANFVDLVNAALAASGLPAQMLELELTESLVLRDIGESIHRMARLQELGVTLAIDDFGTGYSSLNYLRRLPVNELKIDQSFLRDLQSASGTQTVVETIVSLAHAMKLSVIAEGVETVRELEILRAAGCDRVQGHLYGRALPASEVAALLARPDRLVPIREA